MFKAVLIERDERPYRATLASLESDRLPAGDVTVRVEYSTLNYKDALAITGRAPVVRQFPMVPGIDFAGSVQESENPSYRVGDLVLDRSRHEVKAAGRVIDCTATEFKLLAILMERQGRVQERDRLLTDVWGYDSVIDTRTVDTHMRRLRDKLGLHGSYIETVRGFGYRLAPPDGN